MIGPLYVLEWSFPMLIKTWHFPLFMYLLRLNTLIEKCTAIRLTNAFIWIQRNWFQTLLLYSHSFISSLYCLMSLWTNLIHRTNVLLTNTFLRSAESWSFCRFNFSIAKRAMLRQDMSIAGFVSYLTRYPVTTSCTSETIIWVWFANCMNSSLHLRTAYWVPFSIEITSLHHTSSSMLLSIKASLKFIGYSKPCFQTFWWRYLNIIVVLPRDHILPILKELPLGINWGCILEKWWNCRTRALLWLIEWILKLRLRYPLGRWVTAQIRLTFWFSWKTSFLTQRLWAILVMTFLT